MSTQIVTGKVRFSYVYVFEPHASNPGQEAKYSISIIIPKSDTKTIAAIKAAVEEAKELGKAKWGGKIPKVLKTPLRDGDAERDDEAYKNSYFFNATSKKQPGVVDAKVQPILDPEELYSGCYGRVQVNFYPFAAQGNNGVAASIQNIQKTADGERLGGSAPTPESAFGAFGGDDDDCLD